MKLELFRTYYTLGTNGSLCLNGKQLCATIELPWKKNEVRISCIPEGGYRLVKRWSLKFGQHLWLPDVQDRSLILLHPANNALKELKGCIAPVSLLTGPGSGIGSKPALVKLLDIIRSVPPNEQIMLYIRSAPIPSGEHDSFIQL